MEPEAVSNLTQYVAKCPPSCPICDRFDKTSLKGHGSKGGLLKMTTLFSAVNEAVLQKLQSTQLKEWKKADKKFLFDE